MGFGIDESEGDILQEAFTCVEQGKFKRAREIAEEVLESTPDDVDALSIMVQTLLLAKDQKGAREALDRWEKIDPEDPYLFTQNAQYHICNLDFDRALEYLDKVLEREPDFFEGLIMKAQILSLMGEKSHEEFIRRAREVDEEQTEDVLGSYWIDAVIEPDEFFFSEIEKIEHLIESERTEEARQMISEVRDMGCPDEVVDVIKRMELDSFMVEGREEEVERRVKRWLKDDPEDTVALDYSARSSYFRGDLEKALETIDKVISIGERDFDELDHFGSYAFKSEILKDMGDEGWKEWKEKSDEMRDRFLDTMVERFGEEVLPFEMKKDISRKSSGERKEKRLDEFF